MSASSSLSGINSGSFSFNADDQLSTESYDANGNVTATGGKTFRYDSENHLISANGGAVTLLYDGDGKLRSKDCKRSHDTISRRRPEPDGLCPGR